MLPLPLSFTLRNEHFFRFSLAHELVLQKKIVSEWTLTESAQKHISGHAIAELVKIQ